MNTSAMFDAHSTTRSTALHSLRRLIQQWALRTPEGVAIAAPGRAPLTYGRLLARVERGEPVRMVKDQRLTPTFTADLGGAVVAAVEAGATGLLHLTNSGSCS